MSEEGSMYEEDEEESGPCPFCGGDEECGHYVTTIDRTFPYALGLTKAKVEPTEPLGWDAAGELALAIMKLLRFFLKRDPPWTPIGVKRVLKVHSTLRALVVAEYEDSELYEDDEFWEVDTTKYTGFEEWLNYIDDVLTRTDGKIAYDSYTAGGPGMSSSYGRYWAKDGDDVAGAAQGMIYDDQARIEAVLAKLTGAKR